MKLGRRSLLRLVGAAAVVGPQAVNVAQKPAEKVAEVVKAVPSSESGYMIRMMAEREAIMQERIRAAYYSAQLAAKDMPSFQITPKVADRLQAAYAEVAGKYWAAQIDRGTVGLFEALEQMGLK